MFMIKNISRKTTAQLIKNISRNRTFLTTTIPKYADYPPHTVVGLPALSPTMEEGTVQGWTVEVGGEIEASDIVCQIETDKAAVDFEATDDGFMALHLVEPGHAPIPVGTPIMILVEEEEDVAAFANATASEFVSKEAEKEEPVAAVSSTPPPSTPTPVATPATASPAKVPVVNTGERVFASPLARSIARSNGVDINQMQGQGTGPKGRILKEDVEQFLASGGATATAGVDLSLSPEQIAIADALTQSKREVPHYYLTVDLNLDQLLEIRNHANHGNDELEVSVNDFLLKAAAKAMKAVPDVNASWMGSYIRNYDYVDINVVVSNGTNGTCMPVVRDVDILGLSNIAETTQALSQAARNGTLSADDLDVGTFTMMNVGAYGVRQLEAIVQQPQSCILSIGAATEQVVPSSEVGNLWDVSTVASATLSCDHRVVDGAVGAAWLGEFKTLVENPSKLLL